MNHLKLNNPEMKLFVASMGKLFQVTAIATSDEEANEHCAKNDREGVIACDKYGLIYIADIYGRKCPSELIETERATP